MRGNAATVGENRPKLSSHESTVSRRQDSRTSNASRSKLVFKEHAQVAESNSAVQSKLATVSSGNPDVRSFPQKIGRTKNASVVDALRCTQIPGPKHQRRLPWAFIGKTEADRRSQNEVSHVAILHNKQTKSTKAKSLSLIADVIADCRIPEPTKNRASFGRKSIGEGSALQPQGKASCKSVPLLKEDLAASQRKQVKSGSSRTSVVPVNKPSRISAVQKAPRLPNASSNSVCQSCIGTSISKLSNINNPDDFASGKDGANSNSYTVLQLSYPYQSSQERVLENSNNSPSADFLLLDRVSGISSITPGPPRTSVVLEDNSLGGLSISGKRFSGQTNVAKASSLAKSITGSVLVESCIESDCWTRVKQTGHSQLSPYNAIEIIPHNTLAATPTGRTLPDAKSFNHDDSQTTESHREQESCIYSSDCFSSKDVGHNPSGALMAPNWNFLKLDLENDSPLESPVRPPSVIHKTSNDGGQDGLGNESHLTAKQISHATTKRSPKKINFAASKENREARSSKNSTKNKLLTRVNASSSSVLSTFSDFIKKRSNNSRAVSVGIHGRIEDASISSVQTKGNLKKCPQLKTEELLKEGASSAMNACPLFCSEQSSKTPDQLSQVKKQELVQESLPSKTKSCQEPDPNINKLSDQLMSDQLKSHNRCRQRKGSKTMASQKHVKYLQSKDVNTSALQRKGGEEEQEVKDMHPENQNPEEKDLSTTSSANQSHKEAETKTSKSTESYKETNGKTSMSEKDGQKHTNLTKLSSDRQESTKLLSLKQCHKQSDTQKIAPEPLCQKEGYSRKVTRGNKNQGETDSKKVTFEDKSHKGTDSRKVTFENQIHKKTEFVKMTSGRPVCRETNSRIETTKYQQHEQKSESQHSLSEDQNRKETVSESVTPKNHDDEKEFEIVVLKSQSRQTKHPQHSLSEDQTRKETLSELVTSENHDEKDFELVVLKSQSQQKKHPQKKRSKSKSAKEISLAENSITRREQKPVRRTNPTQNANLTNLLAAIHGENSGRQVVLTAGKLASHGGCPFKGLTNMAGSGAKSLSTTSQLARTAKAPTQITKSSIEELKQGLGFLADLDGMEEELKTLVKEFKALEEGEDLLSSSSEYDSDTSLPSSSSPSSSPAAPSSSNFIRPESRRLSLARDKGIPRRWSTAKFYKFLPVFSPKQKLLSRIPQNKKDPSEWIRSQTALETHREATSQQQPKRTTSETSYLSPSSNRPDDPLGSFVGAIDAAATPKRYPKISDIRFNEASNQDLCAVNAADGSNFWATLFVEMPTRSNTTVYNIKIELACCALRAFFDPCDRIKFAYVRSVREKLTELIQDGLARPKFDEFVCCERYDCVLVLSLDAGALLRHPKTSFVYSLSAVLEVEPNRVLVLVSTDS